MSAEPPPKKDQLLKLLDRGSVFVHLDPRREGVRVPEWLGARHQLVLQLGLNFAIPIPDLKVDEEGVQCTLSFNRSPFLCVLPWSAVYALVAEDGQVTVWPRELPPELVPEPATVRKAAPTSRGERTKVQRPKIAAVPMETMPEEKAIALEEKPAEKAPEKVAAKPGKREKADKAEKPAKTKPVLAEVRTLRPSAPPPAAEPPAPEASAEPESKPSAPPPADGTKKKTRELPSYLRVVK